MSIIVRTHGGFGNQIFQIFYARLYAKKYGLTLKEVYDGSYYHGFPRSPALRTAPKPTRFEKFISDLRIPKVLEKAHIAGERPYKIFRSIYLDSYFQTVTSYADFSEAEIRKHLRDLSDELGIGPARKDQTLIHIRLGDFFKSRASAQDHAVSRLLSADEESAIITNDEPLFSDPLIADLLKKKKCQIVSTEGLRAEEVLRMMADYRQIDANDSTLVFWSSVLGGCKTHFEIERLRLTHAYFTKLFQARRANN